MEAIEGFLASVAAWWDAVPAIPDLDLSEPSDPALLIVIATLVTALGVMGVMTGWVEKRLSFISVAATTFGAALFFWVWETDRDEMGFISVPEAFIELVARILR